MSSNLQKTSRMSPALSGVCLMIVSAFFFSLSSTWIGLVGKHFNSHMISVVRFCIGLLLGFSYFVVTKRSFHIKDKKSWLLRGVFGASSMILFYMAIEMTGSARATFTNNMYVIFVAVFGVLFFREKTTARSITGIILCLAAVCVIFLDPHELPAIGDAVGFISGAVSGISIQYTKRSSEQDDPVLIYMSPCLLGLLFTPLARVITPPDHFFPYILLALIGASSFLAQCFMARGYEKMTAVRGSLISYLKIPMTALLALTAGESIGIRFWIGTGLLILSIVIESGIVVFNFRSQKTEPVKEKVQDEG